jgi:hypothetical protein
MVFKLECRHYKAQTSKYQEHWNYNAYSVVPHILWPEIYEKNSRLISTTSEEQIGRFVRKYFLKNFKCKRKNVQFAGNLGVLLLPWRVSATPIVGIVGLLVSWWEFKHFSYSVKFLTLEECKLKCLWNTHKQNFRMLCNRDIDCFWIQTKDAHLLTT